MPTNMAKLAPVRRVSNDEEQAAKKEEDDRMAIVAALAMTELIGRTGTTAAAPADQQPLTRKRKVSECDAVVKDQNIKKRAPPLAAGEDHEVRAVVSANSTMSPPHSRDNSPVGMMPPPPPPPPQFLKNYPYSHTPYTDSVAMKVPSPKAGTRVSPTYGEMTRNSGLPKSLSFRKICSKCGKTRGEHGELGFGNKCVYQECGRCGAGIHMHVKNRVPMGILCTLTEEQGALRGASDAYDRKIRELAFRAECQKDMQQQAQQQRDAAATNPVSAL
jgi:hypothetical protein